MEGVSGRRTATEYCAAVYREESRQNLRDQVPIVGAISLSQVNCPIHFPHQCQIWKTRGRCVIFWMRHVDNVFLHDKH